MAESASFGSRDERIAYNEAHRRELNERKSEWMKDGRLVPQFRCECGHAECFERVALTDEQWAEARARPTRFAVAPSHVAVGVETVAKRYPNVWLVEKHDRAGEVAEKLS